MAPQTDEARLTVLPAYALEDNEVQQRVFRWYSYRTRSRLSEVQLYEQSTDCNSICERRRPVDRGTIAPIVEQYPKHIHTHTHAYTRQSFKLRSEQLVFGNKTGSWCPLPSSRALNGRDQDKICEYDRWEEITYKLSARTVTKFEISAFAFE